MANDTVSSHTLEIVLESLPRELFQPLYSSAFRGQLATMAAHRSANFAIQRLLAAAHHPGQVTLLFEELLPRAHDLLYSWNRVGVMQAIVTAAATHGVDQKKVMQTLCRVTKLTSPTDYPALVTTLGGIGATHTLVGPAGRTILESLLSFDAEAISPLVSSIGSLTGESLVSLASDSNGSRVVEAMFSCSAIDETMRLKLLKRLLPNVVDLAKDRCGSHVVETCFTHASIDFKTKIARKLSEKYTELFGNPMGRRVLVKCKVKELLDEEEVWRAKEESAAKQKAKFDEMLAEENKTPDQRARDNEKKASKLGGSKTDAVMAALGGGALEKGKAKKDKRQATEIEPWEASGEVEGEAADTVDQLFKHRTKDKKKGKGEKERKTKKAKRETVSSEGGAEQDTTATHGLEGVMSALAASTGKRKKAKAKKEEEANKRDKKKKRRHADD